MGVFPEGMDSLVGEHVEHNVAKGSVFFHAVSYIEMTVKQRVERGCTFQDVFGIEAFAAFCTCLEINEVHISTQRGNDEFLRT